MHSAVQSGIVLLIAVTCVYCALPPQVQLARGVCKKKSDVSEEVYSNAEQLKFDWNDRKLQCYSRCIFEKAGVLKADGQLDMQVFYGLVPDARKPITGKAALECQNSVDDSDLCKKSLKMYECIYNKVGSKSIFV